MKAKPIQAPGLALAFSSNEIEAIRKETRLGAIDIELTKKCDLKCIYCYANAGIPHIREMSTQKIKAIIDEASSLGAKIINLTGGEPLLHPDFFLISDYALRKRLNIICFTNGMNITKDVATELANKEVSVCAKLDSLNNETQDVLTGVQDSLPKILKGINFLLSSGYGHGSLSFSVNSVATRYNVNEIPAVWRWARERSIIPSVSRAHPHGRAKSHNELLLGTEQFRGLLMELQSIDRQYGYNWEVEIPWSHGKACRRYHVGCYVNVEGIVQPCSELELNCGSLVTDTLENILANSPIIKVCRNIEEHIKGACKDCSFKNKCYGCRALAFDFTGDYLEADPLCWHNPNSYEQ